MSGAAESIEAAAADWIVRQDRGEWRPEDEAALQSWLSDSRHRVAYLRLQSAWQRQDRLAALKPVETQAPAAPTPPTRWRRVLTGALAASLLIGCAGLLLQATRPWWDRGEPETLATAKWRTLSSAVGQMKTVRLNDGTRIQLNTDSRIAIASASGFRAVRLDRGEAFFDVAHDADRPFSILIGSRKITVLGTKFGVSRDKARLEVAVLEGRVQLEEVSHPGGPPRSVTLARNDLAVAGSAGMLISHQGAQQMLDRLSWRTGNIVFSNARLGDVARQFNRYNRKQILFEDGRAARLKIGGSFDPRNLDGFARLLSQGFDLSVKDDGQSVSISVN